MGKQLPEFGPAPSLPKIRKGKYFPPPVPSLVLRACAPTLSCQGPGGTTLTAHGVCLLQAAGTARPTWRCRVVAGRRWCRG
jgi:hypothetical protein